MYFLESHRSVFLESRGGPRSGRRAFATIFRDFGEKVAQQAGSFFSNPFFEIKRFSNYRSSNFQIPNFQIFKFQIFKFSKFQICEFSNYTARVQFWSTKKSSQMRGGRSAALHGILKITLRFPQKCQKSKILDFFLIFSPLTPIGSGRDLHKGPPYNAFS